MTVDYPTIPLPRARDMLLADFFVMHCTEQIRLIVKDTGTSKLAGLYVCGSARGILFFSDMASANGRHLRRMWLAPIVEGAVPPTSFISRQKFQLEQTA